jgi:predicted nuclease of predicted toxin-antitoxin system
LKFKLDENLDPRLAAEFSEAGLEADTVRDEALSGASDAAIYAVCQSEDRCLITLDLDFANPIRFPPEQASGIVVLRPFRPTYFMMRALIATFLPSAVPDRIRGKLWIVEPGRIREYEP